MRFLYFKTYISAKSNRRTNMVKKKPPAKAGGLCSRYLFSRPVTRQLSSAYVSLTSVFGMGTGGPSPQSTRTFKSYAPSKLNIKSFTSAFYFTTPSLRFGQAFGLLVSVSSIHYCTSTSDLSTSSSTTSLSGDLILGRVSRLDAFSVYLVRT